MKPQLPGTKERLQEELVAAIHGAFEVAVELAVQEVSKLVGQATGDICEEMRRENESLKQRLQRAEAMLDSARMEERGCSSPPPPAATDQWLHPKYSHQKVGNVHGFGGVRGDSPPAGHSRADRPPDPQHKHVSRNEEQRPNDDVKMQHVSDADPDKNHGCAIACDVLTKGMFLFSA